MKCGAGSSVGMATNYGLYGPGLNPGRAKRHCPPQNRTYQICCPLKPEVKRPRPEVDY